MLHLMEYNHATNNHSFIIRGRIGRGCETAGVVMDINKSTEGGEGVAVVIGRGDCDGYTCSSTGGAIVALREGRSYRALREGRG